jgi:hypothetical protein
VPRKRTTLLVPQNRQYYNGHLRIDQAKPKAICDIWQFRNAYVDAELPSGFFVTTYGEIRYGLAVQQADPRSRRALAFCGLLLGIWKHIRTTIRLKHLCHGPTSHRKNWGYFRRKTGLAWRSNSFRPKKMAKTRRADRMRNHPGLNSGRDQSNFKAPPGHAVTFRA